MSARSPGPSRGGDRRRPLVPRAPAPVLAAALALALVATACGPDDAAPPDATPPAAPTGLAAAPDDGRVALSWSANAEPDLAGYVLHWGRADAAPDGSVEIAAPRTDVTVTGLENGSSYAFALEAEDEAGNRSPRSAPVTATPTSGPGEPGEPGEPDVAPPTVTATRPADGAADVAVNAGVAVTFSEPMDRAATEAALALEPELGCGFRWSPAGTTLTCTPTSDLAESTTYALTVGAGARDAAGNALASPFASTFTTGRTRLERCVFGAAGATFGGCLFAP